MLYNKISFMSISKIPSKIKVRIEKQGSVWTAYLPEHNAFTEFDSLFDLPYYVNDLIYSIFDIPKKEQKDIYFAPIQRKPDNKEYSYIDPRIVLFNKLLIVDSSHALS